MLLRHNLEIFEKEEFDYLITSCATCTATIKKIWPAMAEDDLKKRAKKIGDKTLDIHQFLVSKLRVQVAKGGKDENLPKITYHDPCHLKKSIGVFTEPRKLIKTNINYSFVEMEEADKCCGMGGSFNITHYDLSDNIGKVKADNIAASKASIIATGCPACMLHISDMLSKRGSKIKVKHSIEIYAKHLFSSSSKV